MWIVRLALNRPYTFIVASILILVLGFSSIATTPTDIFPNIDIPVVTVIWSYSGLPAKEMEQRITTFSEFVMAVVNDVKAIDSQTVNGRVSSKFLFSRRYVSMPRCPRWGPRSIPSGSVCRPG
jgi:multidrug efflux pump subunit AcrB